MLTYDDDEVDLAYEAEPVVKSQQQLPIPDVSDILSPSSESLKRPRLHDDDDKAAVTESPSGLFPDSYPEATDGLTRLAPAMKRVRSR